MSDPNTTSTPIVVPSDPTGAQIETLIGQGLAALGGVLTTFGVLTTEKWTAVGGLLAVLATGGWRLWRTTHNQAKLRTLAEAAPDTVGQIKN